MVNTRKNKKALILDITEDFLVPDLAHIRNILGKENEQDCRFLIVNFHRVKEVPFGTLGLLVEELKELKNRGGDLKLTGLSGPLKKFFDTVGVTSLFQVCRNEKEALERIPLVTEAA